MSRLVDLGEGVWVDPAHVVSVSDSTPAWPGAPRQTCVETLQSLFRVDRPIAEVLVLLGRVDQ